VRSRGGFVVTSSSVSGALSKSPLVGEVKRNADASLLL
jgi:hypothetical protein